MNLIPFLVGFVIMSLSSIAIYAKGAKWPPAHRHTHLHAAVPFIAATSYLAMTCTIGDVVKLDGTVTLVSRYVDWTFTTPLLLTGLVITATHGRRETAPGFLVSLVTLDVLMIVAGLLSSLAIVPFLKIVWFLWSCAAFVGVLYVLWVPLRATSAAAGGPLAGAYRRNATFLTVVWFLYPIVFVIGPEGIGAISTDGSSWAILVLDVVAKVIYAFFAASNVERALREGGEYPDAAFGGAARI